MKARGKLVSLLMALVCLLPIGVGLLGFGDSASAAEPKNVKVTLHKKKMDDFPKGLENNGAINQEIEEKYEGLADVTFRPWDITEAFYEKLAAEGITGSEDKETYDAKVKEVMEGFEAAHFEGNTSQGNPKKQPVAGADAKATGADGTVDFTLPDRDADGVYRVYWFEETLPADAEEFSQLVILALPVLKVGTEVQSDDIHLYPKNKLPNKPVKELLDDEGKGEDPAKGPYSFDVGKQIKYRVTYQIPLHIGELIGEGATEQTRYSKLTFKDEVTHAGVRFVGFESIKALGETPAQDVDLKTEIEKPNSIYVNTQKFNFEDGYTAAGKAGFEIAYTLDNKQGGAAANSKLTAQYLSDFAGKTVEIIYTVQFTKDTPIDQEIGNNFYVDLQQNGKDEAQPEVPEVVPPKIITGGKKFIKHESGDNAQVLKGAEFVITNKAGTMYLAGTPDNYTWKDVVDDKYEGAIRITSSDDGSFEITGLKFGDYQLVETKAPNGYVKGGPVDFVVEKDKYDVEVALRQGIANVSRGGFLPSTGGIGIAIFLIIGGSLMAFAVSRYRKQQHAA